MTSPSPSPAARLAGWLLLAALPACLHPLRSPPPSTARVVASRTPPDPYRDEIGDRDRDGVHDSQDRCPSLVEDVDQFQDDDGCPDPDNDQDGIADVRDRCPNQAGPRETGGCPERRHEPPAREGASGPAR